jgi:hypothetical protein
MLPLGLILVLISSTIILECFSLLLHDRGICLVNLGVIINLIHHFSYPHFPTAQVPTKLAEGVGVCQIFYEMLVIVRVRECVPFVQLRDKDGT